MVTSLLRRCPSCGTVAAKGRLRPVGHLGEPQARITNRQCPTCGHVAPTRAFSPVPDARQLRLWEKEVPR